MERLEVDLVHRRACLRLLRVGGVRDARTHYGGKEHDNAQGEH